MTKHEMPFMDTAAAAAHYQRARAVLPGGVTAAARFNRYLDRPLYVAHAKGSSFTDVDGKSYIDLCTSYGASLLGHAHPAIAKALSRAIEFGIACGSEYPAEAELAEKICAAIPSAEMVRFTLSGTETTWLAIRLARVYTGRTKVIKLEGHFHGFNDYLQYNYWPTPERSLPNVRPETPGFPADSDQQVIVLPFNDAAAVEQAVAEHSGQIAALIFEPVNFNSGGIQPQPGYLEKLREITRRAGIVLIFDEVLSGFRTGPGCMQAHYGVTPDMTTFGKAIGGGVPLSAFSGRREIMSCVAPAGAMMHSGTYNANAVNIYCGNAFMDLVQKEAIYPDLLRRSNALYDGLNAIFAEAKMPARAHGLGARFGLLFGPAAAKAPVSYRDVQGQDWDLGNRFFRETFRRGVFFNNGWHHGLSVAHSDADITTVLDVCAEAARTVMTGP